MIHTQRSFTRFVWLGVTTTLALSAYACSGSNSQGSGGSHVCVPGSSVACTGPAGCSGGQVCKADGSGYDTCACGGGDGGGQDAGQEASGGGATYKGELNANKIGTTFIVAGDFYLVPDGGVSQACPGTQMGACCYSPPPSADAGGPQLMLASAGVLTAKDQSTVMSMINPNANLLYADISNSNAMLHWNAGDMLSFSASGAAVHPFTVQVDAPDDIGGTMPTLGMTAITVNTQKDYLFYWSPGSAAGAKIAFELGDNTPPSVGTIDCNANDSDAMVTVPQALLANFKPADMGTVSISRFVAGTASADNAAITLTASTTLQGTTTYQ